MNDPEQDLGAHPHPSSGSEARWVEEGCRLNRRALCRALAASAAALCLGGAVPAWAKPGKEQKDPSSTPAPPDAAPPKYETKVLWDFDGCLEDRFMNRVTTHVYNGNAYLWVLLPGYKTTIVKVPLDGGKPQVFPLMPGHVTGADPHRFYTIAADAQGYIHVVGDMHSSAHVKHWVSKRPEDISEFTYTSDQGEDKRPQGYNVTYPHLFRSPDGVLYHSIRCADPVWGIGISVFDVKTQTWTMLGADVAAADVSKGNRAKKVKGRPLTAWEDNGEGGDFSYTQPHALIRWDRKKRMHVSFVLLNENTPSSKGAHTGSDVLYACSDDGGKTFRRGDGTPIRLPMRAEAGPHQADVVYSRHDGPPPWVGLMAGLSFDEQDRPVVRALDHKTGPHSFVLEAGKWVPVTKGAAAPATDAAAKPKDEDDEEDPGKPDAARLRLPYEPHRVAAEYREATGNLLYTVFPEKDRAHGDKPKHHRILLVLSKPVKA
ncbi:MAG TPA: BNR-4 repeat-containing protein [Humisphaera sp.]